MDIDKLSSLVERIMFGGAFVLLAAAIVGKAANREFLGYEPSRLLELAVVTLVFVLALLIRQVREELRKPRTV